MRKGVSLWWFAAVLIIAIIGIAVTSCVAPGFNPDAAAPADAIREQVKELSFNNNTCYVYVGYGISCVPND